MQFKIFYVERFKVAARFLINVVSNKIFCMLWCLIFCVMLNGMLVDQKFLRQNRSDISNSNNKGFIKLCEIPVSSVKLILRGHLNKNNQVFNSNSTLADQAATYIQSFFQALAGSVVSMENSCLFRAVFVSLKWPCFLQRKTCMLKHM